ncbi:hypothetical protein GLOIN_2v774408 [Rhizophagus irregularis DAOM 181602=DAOM 197198]|nr:hypothetical protein GLOIN_2v774408 [Rhizophagus irregularis DAOM 181602=DAOM 197198]
MNQNQWKWKNRNQWEWKNWNQWKWKNRRKWKMKQTNGINLYFNFCLSFYYTNFFFQILDCEFVDFFWIFFENYGIFCGIVD